VLLQVISFDGKRYRKYGTYFTRGANGTTEYLHRAVWQHHNGPIPAGVHIHHKDGNPDNNAIENLEAIDGREHVREHGLVAPHLKSQERLALLDRIREASHESRRTEENRAKASAKARVYAASLSIAIVCAECGTPAIAHNGRAKYCSKRCCSRAHERTRVRR
jgi:hypothetical protein